MSFAQVTSSFRVERRRRGPLAEALRIGALGGGAAVAYALVGAYVVMDGRAVVEDTVTLAQTVVLAIGLAIGWFGARAALDAGARSPGGALAGGLAAGVLAGAMLAALVLLTVSVNLRSTLVAASPALVRALSFGLGLAAPKALAALTAAGAAAGLAGAAIALAPVPLRRAVLAGLAAVVGVGLFRDVAASVLDKIPGARGLESAVFGPAGVEPAAAAVVFLAVAALRFLGRRDRPGAAGRTPGMTPVRYALLAVGLLAVPLVTNDFVAQVAMLVALYALMGMGLNVELGLAGLVDLGFVAFFAVGAYTVALLTSGTSYAIADLSFWVALPAAILLAAVAGLLFGLPVLRVRGDYLAMATLGLGEIVRVLVLSEALAPYLGGSQGIIDIPRPDFLGVSLNTPAELYYLAIALAALVAVASRRLRHSRIGRAWQAVREDEDVAQALGIDLVAVKLLAYTVGAAFAGAAGAVFAVLIGAVFPHSFQLIVSMNVLAILVIGGLGSLPGVIVGAIALIGLPELLREFGEFRYLFYGLALVVMMHVRPEGLWPDREADHAVGPVPEPSAAPVPAPAAAAAPAAPAAEVVHG